MFNGNFSINQGQDASSFSLTDVSTGSDPNLTGRTISLYKIDGSLLGGSTINWPIADSSIDLTNILPRDYSLNIQVVWASSSPLPDPSTYTKEQIVTFEEYTQDFDYGLVQQWSSANPPILQKSQFYQNMMRLRVDLDSAVLATDYSNQYSAEVCLDDAFYLIQHANLFF